MNDNARRAIEILKAAGFVEDGQTRAETVRIPTQQAPVFGGSGGEVRTLGGRARFALPGTPIRATVGARTTYIYERDGSDVRTLAHLATRFVTAGGIAGVLSPADYSAPAVPRGMTGADVCEGFATSGRPRTSAPRRAPASS